MGKETGRDGMRQAANVVGALFQIGMTAAASATIQGVVDEGPRSLVEPALYAFTIWALIFTLSLAYAVYQALPAKRESPLLRRLGPFTATAFFCTGLWSVFVPLRQLGLAQLMLLGIFIFLLIAYLRLSRHARERDPSIGERWLVALPLGLIFGWITAANVVSLNDTLVELGLLGSGVGGALAGVFLLLVGAALASVVILVSGAGPLQGLLAYAGAVLWALTGVVLNQYDTSLLTTGAALFSSALVAMALINTLRGRRPHIGAIRSVRPRTAEGKG